jgi:predicted alpha/beta hydrolase
MATLWHAAIPLFNAVLGYLPMSRIAGGEDIPRGVAAQWARWGRDPLGGHEAFRYSRPLRAYAIADDGYAPRRGVEALVGMFPRARAEVLHVAPADLGVPAIGHFGAFREAFRDSLWAEWREWLLRI